MRAELQPPRMKPGLDHVLVAVDDVAAAVEAFRTLGFAAAAGGTHPAFGTHNGLVPLADGGYIELIGVLDRTLAVQHPHTARVVEALGRDNRLALFALQVDDADAEAARLKLSGIRADGPVNGERIRPDGVRVAWKSLHPRDTRLPFLIEDVTPHELRAIPPEEGVGATAVLSRLHVAVQAGTPLAHAMVRLVNAAPEPAGTHPTARGLETSFGLATARGVLQFEDDPGIAEDGLPVLLEIAVPDPQALAASWRLSGVRHVIDPHGRLRPDPRDVAGAELAFVARSAP